MEALRSAALPPSPPGSVKLLGKRRSAYDGAAASPQSCMASTPERSKLPAKSSLYRVLQRQPCATASSGSSSASAEDAPAIAAPPMVGPTQFFLTPPQPGAGARVLEYQLLCPLVLLLRRPAASAASLAPPSDEELRALDCDGWRDEAATTGDGASVTLLVPGNDEEEPPLEAGDQKAASSVLLRLVDDDKQVGLTQTSLPDLFFRLSMRGGAAR